MRIVLSIAIFAVWFAGVAILNRAVRIGSPHFPATQRWFYIAAIASVLPLAYVANA